jgi:hypothetical protein
MIPEVSKSQEVGSGMAVWEKVAVTCAGKATRGRTPTVKFVDMNGKH